MTISDSLTFSLSDENGSVCPDVQIDGEKIKAINDEIIDVFVNNADVEIPEQDCPNCGQSHIKVVTNWQTIAGIVDEKLDVLMANPLERHMAIGMFISLSQNEGQQIAILYDVAKKTDKATRNKKTAAFVKHVKKMKKNAPDIGKMIAAAIIGFGRRGPNEEPDGE